MRRRNLLAAALLGAVMASLVPAAPASAEVVVETLYVPTVDGARVRVEIRRDPKFDPQPILLTYSPYNSLADASPSNDGFASRYVPKGYARAVADVLGTRGSTGCWDYGGPKEQQSGVDVVKFLAAQPWSNGNVGMIGVSYNGTTTNMIAARGSDVPELKAIVSIAGISAWYGYAFYDGVRYFLNTRVPTDEGFDTPLAFDYGFGRTVPADNPGMITERIVQCEDESLLHTQEGYNRSPDYDQFWLERDYVKDAAKFRAAVMVIHGWQDYNVKQDEGLKLYEALPVDDPETLEVTEGVPFKMLVMSQSAHAGAPGISNPLIDRFFDKTLKGIDTGIEDEPPVRTLGRTAAGADADYRTEPAWPPPATSDVNLYLGRAFTPTGEPGWLKPTPQNTGGGWVHVNPGTISEELTLRDPLNREVTNVNGTSVRGHGYYSLYQESDPLAQDVRIAGRAVFDAYANLSNPSQHLTPLLVEVLPDGTLNLVERGFLNLDYRNGRAKAEPASGWQHGRVSFLPQDYTFKKGNRIGLILQGSNTVWAVPGNPGQISYAMGKVNNVTNIGSFVSLPVVNPPANPADLFVTP
jgi:X-Pro dipeptidyl-peptidase